MRRRWDALDIADLERLRDRKLKGQLRSQLLAHSPYYREVLEQAGTNISAFSGLQDFAWIPITTRKDLAGRPNDFLLRPSEVAIQRWAGARQLTTVFINQLLAGVAAAERRLEDEYRPVHTLQSLGPADEPISINLTRRDLALLAEGGRRLYVLAGVAEGETVLNLIPPLPSGGFWSFWLGAVARGLLQLVPGPISPPEAAELARRHAATTLVAPAADALELLELQATPSIRRVLLGPERIAPGQFQRLEMAADATLIRTYGFAEGRSVWAECAEGAGRANASFHAFPDLEVVESAPGPAEVLFTGLEHRGTALARYAPGDVAMGGIALEQCPHCGRAGTQVAGPIVRSQNLITIHPDGYVEPITFDADSLSTAMAHPGVAAWQVEFLKERQDPWAPDEVLVRFRPRGAADPAGLVAALNRALTGELGFSPTQFILAEKFQPGISDSRRRNDTESIS